MNDFLGYQGKDVVITGAASGMGKAAAQLLVDAGANVYALDIAEVSVPVTKVIKVDMKNQDSLDEALSQLPGSIYAHFNCAGVPSPPFSSDDAVMINFAGLRYLTESLIPRIVEGGAIASIASTAGMGWKHSLDLINEFLALDNSLASARQWLSEHVDAFPDGYSFSKSCMIVYTMSMAQELAVKNIRINCISPSPTDSNFMTQLKGEGQVPEDAVAMFLPSNGRYATGEDMGRALVMLNSQLAGFVSGNNLPVDYGYCAEVVVGQRDNLLGLS